MTRVVRWAQVCTESMSGLKAVDGLNEHEMFHGLAGYILQQPSASSPRRMIHTCSYMVIVNGTLDEPEVNMALPIRPLLSEAHPTPLQLRPIGRLVPVSGTRPAPLALPAISSLRPIRSGQIYRITSPPARGLVTPELAEALETVFERFARERDFTAEKPLEIQLARGFKSGSHGHGEGRAADIAAAGGKTLLEWKQEWDHAMTDAEKLSDPQPRAEAIAGEQKRNLGFGLYKALQQHGGWRVNPKGWRVYRGVMQLFSPWTATEGPWKTMEIKEPNVYQQRRLADQQWVFQAHHDHIHVAR